MGWFDWAQKDPCLFVREAMFHGRNLVLRVEGDILSLTTRWLWRFLSIVYMIALERCGYDFKAEYVTSWAHALTASRRGRPLETAFPFRRFKTSQEVRTLPCGHTFHDACILPWLSKKATCPLDRTNFKAGCVENGSSKQRLEPKYRAGSLFFDLPT